MPNNVARGGFDSLWKEATDSAQHTPQSRNRYVDFLRATSIVAVVFGHWFALAPHVASGQLEFDHVLLIAPWTSWLTWGLQVMPVFFMVGGYANAASWESAQRQQQGYGEWVAARLHRLIGPVVLLVVVWVALGICAHYVGISLSIVAISSRSALIPTWFLSVYIMVVVSVPLSHWAFRRAGAVTFWLLALCAGLLDIAGLAGGYSQLRWLNYGFVWLAVHQLGYLWRAGALASVASLLLLTLSGAAILTFLVNVAGYPISMISIPGEEMSNSSPPTVALIALALLQGGLLLSLEGPGQRWLQRVRPWAATIIVNRSIMTLYLWHMTVLVLVIGLLGLLGGIGLFAQPGSLDWWITRPIWLSGLALVLLFVVALLSPIEHRARKGSRTLSRWQALGGALLICFGLAQLALHGIGTAEPPGIRIWVVTLIAVGVGLISYRSKHTRTVA